MIVHTHLPLTYLTLITLMSFVIGKQEATIYACELDFESLEVDKIAEECGCRNLGQILPQSRFYEFVCNRKHGISKRSLSGGGSVARKLYSHPRIKSVHPQETIVRAKRFHEPASLISDYDSIWSSETKVRVKRSHHLESNISINDPLWSRTWYLNRGISNHSAFDMNIISAWKMGFTGKDVVVTLLDDGIEHNHPDLITNFDARASTDINGRDDDPMPRYDYTNENRHGTRNAGVIAAKANNSVCSIGVAYNAKIGAVRMLDGDVTDSVEARSLSFNRSYIDIYTCGWGPDDNGRTVDGPGRLAKQALIDGVTHGRGGKGSIFMWASGVGGSHSDSCACDGYTNSIYTLSINSASERNQAPWYIEECASNIASTYSSGANYGEKQVVTTDLRKQCTTRHTGTSGSVSLAAGLVAVMLEANPSLTWRDIQYIVLDTANPEPLLAAGQFETNGVNRKFSHKFGFGLMDGGAMVEKALQWKTVPPQLIKRMPNKNINKDFREKTEVEIDVPACEESDNGCIRFLEHVQLVLTMSSSRRGQLKVDLESPLNTRSTVLPKRRSDTSSSGFDNWPFMSLHFWGENPAGRWKVYIDNSALSGRITSYQLILYGVSVDPFNLERPTGAHAYNCSKVCDADADCYGSGPDQCNRCAEELFRVEDTHLCVQECPDGYSPDKEEMKCRKGHSSPQNCTVTTAPSMRRGVYAGSGVYTGSGVRSARRDLSTYNRTKVGMYAGIGVSALVVLVLSVILGIWCIRHRRLQRSFQSFSSSHYNSGTDNATFGNDGDVPMIQGFADDEPLVIA